MSMDSSAIQKIIDLSQERNRIEVGAIPAAIVAKDSSVASLEHLLESPIHHKAKFTTSVFDDFVGYCKVNSDEISYSTIYIDQKAMCARAIFDHGHAANPQWGHHNANLILDKTPEFAALLENNNKDLIQQDFVDFLVDWGKFINLNDVDARLNLQDAINRIRKLSVTSLSKAESEVGNFSANRSALESVEVSAGSTKPPATLLWVGTPYDGFTGRVLSAEIRAKTDGSNIKLRYRITQLNSSINDIANEFRDRIKQALAEVRSTFTLAPSSTGNNPDQAERARIDRRYAPFQHWRLHERKQRQIRNLGTA